MSPLHSQAGSSAASLRNIISALSECIFFAVPSCGRNRKGGAYGLAVLPCFPRHDEQPRPPGPPDPVDAYLQFGRRVRNLSEGTRHGYCRYVRQFLPALGEDDVSATLRRLSADRVQRLVFAYGQGHGPGARR